MALLQLVHSELVTLAPDLWLRTRALEAWLNDKARQGWSLAAMDDADVMLKEDGGGRRYRVVAHAEAGLAAFLERYETEGWRLAGSGEDVYILEDAAGTAKEIEDGTTEAYVRRRCRRKALTWVGLAAACLLLYVIVRLCGDGFHLMRGEGAGGLVCIVYSAIALAAAAICLRRGVRAIEGDVRQNVLRRWWQKNLVLRAAGICLTLVLGVVLAVYPFPPAYPNAPLPEAEAPYTLENVYGLEGEYSAYETDGSFFVPVQANYASSRETFLGRSRFLSVEMAGCRWEWVARRVFDAYTGDGEARPDLAEALGVDALSLSVFSAGGSLLPLDVTIPGETAEWLLALAENTSYPYALRLCYRDGLNVVRIWAEPYEDLAPGGALYEAVRTRSAI